MTSPLVWFDINMVPMTKQPVWVETTEVYVDPSDNTERERPFTRKLERAYNIQPATETLVLTATGTRVVATHVMYGPEHPLLLADATISTADGRRYLVIQVGNWGTHAQVILQAL